MSSAATTSAGGNSGNPPQQPQQIQLESLSIEQLQRIRKQLDEELNLTKTNIAALGTAFDRNSASLDTIKSLEIGDQELMIPLSSSMYARGRTNTKGKVMIDLGTGFYAKVANKEGQAILTRKVEYIAKNRKAFQEELKKKLLMADRVTAVIQQKIKEQTGQ
jgi:prefoldin alpha subunit